MQEERNTAPCHQLLQYPCNSSPAIAVAFSAGELQDPGAAVCPCCSCVPAINTQGAGFGACPASPYVHTQLLPRVNLGTFRRALPRRTEPSQSRWHKGFIQGMSSASGLARFLGFVMVPYTFLPERIAGQWECFCAGAQAPQAAVGSCGVESCKCGPRPCCASLGCRNSCCCSFNPQNNIVLAAPMSLGRFWLALLPVFGFPALSQPCWGSQLLGGQTGCRGGCILPAFPGLHSPGCRVTTF